MAIWAQVNGLDCRKCNSQLKRARGCEKDIKEVEIEGIKITRCPLTFITYAEIGYMEAYYFFKNGYLPNEGGWLNQPMKFCKIMNIIENISERLKEKNGE